MVCARAWIGEGDTSQAVAVDDDLAADFAALGVPVEVSDAGGPREFEVAAENVEALLMFQQLRTQWRYQVAGSRLLWIGLDYSAVTATISATAKKKRRRELFAAMREMEEAALPVLNGGRPAKGDEPWL